MPRPRTLVAGAFGLLLLSGCEIPTESPHWESRWILPAQTTEIALDEFLPAGVTVSPDETSFLLSITPFDRSESLGDLCTECGPADGSTIPKPAFESDFPVPGNLPPQVVSAQLAEGEFLIGLTNGFSFDPIRPGMGNLGQLTITLSNEWPDGTVEPLGSTTLDGAETPFPRTTTVERNLPLTPGPLSPTLSAEVFLDSPEGEPVEIDVSELFAVQFEALTLAVSSIEIEVSGQQLQLAEVALDTQDVDQEIVDRVIAGGFILDVENPFGVALDLSVRISSPGAPAVERDLAIPSTATSSVSVSLTVDELRSFLGQPEVTLSGDAIVSPTTPTITVEPGQVLRLRTSVDLSLRVGSEP